MLGKEHGAKSNMCEHCDKLNEVLTELTGPKVAGVIMRRVETRLHPVSNEGLSATLLVTG
jgi:cytochrome c2